MSKGECNRPSLVWRSLARVSRPLPMRTHYVADEFRFDWCRYFRLESMIQNKLHYLRFYCRHSHCFEGHAPERSAWSRSKVETKTNCLELYLSALRDRSSETSVTARDEHRIKQVDRIVDELTLGECINAARTKPRQRSGNHEWHTRST